MTIRPNNPKSKSSQFGLSAFNWRLSSWRNIAGLLLPLAACVTPPPNHTYQPSEIYTSTGSVETTSFLAPQTDLLEPYPDPVLDLSIRELKDQTVRQIARMSSGGDALKIRFSNEFGVTPLKIDRASVAVSLGLGSIDPRTTNNITFEGKPSITIPPGETAFSDLVPLETNPLSEIAVSLYFSEADVRDVHRFANMATYIGDGDQVVMESIANPTISYSSYYMPEIVSISEGGGDLIVALGDSITDGAANAFMPDTMSWPDYLARLMYATSGASVVNAGIGGNRWVKDNMGPCGLCRLERDVFDLSGATHVIFELGPNDIGLGFRYAKSYGDPSWLVSSADIIDNIQAAAEQAKAKGLKVYMTTIVPMRPADGNPSLDYYTSGQATEVPPGWDVPYNGELVRQEVNAYIRGMKDIDGVIDFDRALQDPDAPLSQLKDLTLEGLHPNDRGARVLAREVFLELTRSGQNLPLEQ